MSRKGQAKIREITPDPKYHDRTLAKFVNVVMERGKKSISEQILYGALDLAAQRIERRGSRDVQEGARQRAPLGRSTLPARRRRQLPGPGRGPSAAPQLAGDAMAGHGGARARREVDAGAAGGRNYGGRGQSWRRGQESAKTHTGWRTRTARSLTIAGKQTSFGYMARTTPIERVRNIGIMAHIDAGKTTTTERVLYYTGINYKIGEVHEGTATMDWMVQEQERGITITSAATTCFWRDHRVNIIDTPGHVDFTIEVERSPARARRRGRGVLRGRRAWSRSPRPCGARPTSTASPASRSSTRWTGSAPNGIAWCRRCATSSKRLRLRSRSRSAPRTSFTGVIDLIEMRAMLWDEDRLGANYRLAEIPAELAEAARGYRDKMIETLADHDEQLMEMYLEGKAPEAPRLREAVRAATLKMVVTPVLLGSAFRNKGVQPMLDAVVEYLPSPLDLPPVIGQVDGKDGRAVAARRRAVLRARLQDHDRPLYRHADLRAACTRDAWKAAARCSTRPRASASGSGGWSRCTRTSARRSRKSSRAISARSGLRDTTTGDTLCDAAHPIVLESIEFPEPVIQIAIEPKTKADQEKLGEALQKLAKEDPSFRVSVNKETAQTLISGMGELHLEIIVDRMLREYKVDANVGKPQVAYRETIRKRRGGRRALRAPDRRPRPVRRGRAADRAAGQGARVRVRRRHQGRLDSAQLHPVGRRRREGGDGERSAGGLPDGGRARDVARRQVPRGRHLGNRVQDCGLDGVQGGLRQGRRRCCSSR